MSLESAALRLASLLVGVAAALLVAELVLRVLGYAGDRERSRTVFDPRWGTVEKDSWIFEFEADPARRESVVLNGQFVRLPKPPGETRLLFIGDSGTQGAFLPLEHSFPRVYQRLLDDERPGHGVRAINAGVFGMTTIDEYHFLEDKLLGLEPDLVVLGLFMSNDINFNLGHRQWRVERGPLSALGAALRARSALAHFLHLRALALSERYGLFRIADPREESLIPVAWGLVDSYGFHMLSYPAGEVATYMREPSALVERAFEVLGEVFAQFQGLGARRGFGFRVVLIPSPSAVAGRLLLMHFPRILEDLREQGVEVGEAQLDVTLPTRRVLEICAGLDLVCIDPTPRLREVGLRVFLGADEHLSVLGHREVALELLERDLLGP